MKKLSNWARDFLHKHPSLRNNIRWLRWQLKKIPGVNRISIAIDTAYFRNAGDERPHADEHEGTDDYASDYGRFILARVHGRVLDVGCGYGYLTQKIAAVPAVTSVVGVDKIADFRCLHPKIQYLTNNLTQPDDFPGKFDVIVSSEFVEHIPEEDHKKVLAKIVKALKPEGAYVGSTPLNPTKFKTFSGSRFHVREYSEKDLKNILLEFFNDVHVTVLSQHGLAWEVRQPRVRD